MKLWICLGRVTPVSGYGLFPGGTGMRYCGRRSGKRLTALPLLIGTLLLPFTVPGGDGAGSAFFRVVSDQSEVIISDLSREGHLSWSNAGVSANYLVERAYQLAPPEWSPLTRGQSSNATVSVKVMDFHPPLGMVFIPGGTFLMGNTNDSPQISSPIFLVTVSPFYMKQHETTVAELVAVLQWAYDHGLVTVNDNYVQDQKGTNILILKKHDSEINFATNTFSLRPGRELYPSHYISWFGAVSCCNWASIMQGLEPCYDLDTWHCDLDKRGYRLPTEAEWEWAARGGYEQKRFPWAHKETITHADGNYRSDTNNWYDVSPTRGYHPDYADLRPGSSPVGTFAPNNFGLYDMSGNVWEWTGDWYARYSNEPKNNPTGPAAGRFKVFRGGAWRTTAERTTCAVRYISSRPEETVNDVGFRMVISYRP